MYTQCSKCETVFKLAPETLRVAGGQVRCGNCGEVFNALSRLAEDANAFASGESALELETRAESILESVVPVQEWPNESEDLAGAGVEIARLEILDWPEDEPGAQPGEDNRSLEFTLPPGELDRIFVESKKTPRPVPPAGAVPSVAAKPVAPAPAPAAPAPKPPAPKPPAPPAPAPAAPAPAPHPESVITEAAPARRRVSGLEVPDDVRREMLAGFEQHLLDKSAAPPAGARRGAERSALLAWLGAAIASALLLIAQFVHQNREWFIAHAHGTFGTGVRALYGAMGTPLPAPASLSAYQLRQWGVTGDPDANGTLRLRASILNSAALLQPFPLLRVTLADRFGKSIGRRDFEPSEYMGKPTARLLAPGERVDATLVILDPGKNAEGFEVDVCLRGVDRKIVCANDAAPQVKP